MSEMHYKCYWLTKHQTFFPSLGFGDMCQLQGIHWPPYFTITIHQLNAYRLRLHMPQVDTDFHVLLNCIRISVKRKLITRVWKIMPISLNFIQETHVREKTPRMTESNPSGDTRDVGILDITLSSEGLDKVRNWHLWGSKGILFLCTAYFPDSLLLQSTEKWKTQICLSAGQFCTLPPLGQNYRRRHKQYIACLKA